MGRKVFALAVAAFFLYVTSSLILPVIMGAILAVLFMPLVERGERKRIPVLLSAALITLVISLLVLVPVGGVFFFGAKSGLHQLRALNQSPGSSVGNPYGWDWIDRLLGTPKVRSILDWVVHYFPSDENSLVETTHDFLQGVVVRVGNWLGQFIAALPGMLLELAVTTVSLFFFLLDGRRLVLFFRRSTLFTPAQVEQILHTLAGACRSVILASMVSGLVQSLIMMAAGFAVGVPDTPLIAGLVYMGSFIPVAGSAPVTFGVAVQQFLMVDTAHGVAMLIVAGLILVADNLVRPAFLRGSAHLHPFLAFVAAFGGLQTFGFIGVFIGPILAALLLAIIHVMSASGASEAPIA